MGCPSSEYPSPKCKKTCEDAYPGNFNDDKLHASKTYSVRGETQIMQELVNNGPMYVSFSVYADFPTYSSGVYEHTTGSALGGHAVTLVGYGELDGTPYWKIKNSWNEQWGDNGHFPSSVEATSAALRATSMQEHSPLLKLSR